MAIALVLESGGCGFDSSVLLVFGDFAWRCGRACCGAVSETRAGNLHAALWTRVVLSLFSPFMEPASTERERGGAASNGARRRTEQRVARFKEQRGRREGSGAV